LKKNEGKRTRKKGEENPKEGKPIQHEYCFMGSEAVQSGEHLTTLKTKPSKQISKKLAASRFYSVVLSSESSVNF
jgi:hypothetical protein